MLAVGGSAGKARWFDAGECESENSGEQTPHHPPHAVHGEQLKVPPLPL